MTNTEDLQAFFERFADSGKKHAFRLLDGSECLGWVIEVGEDGLLFAHAPSPLYAQSTAGSAMEPPDQWIAFSEIEIGSLGYWDAQANQWQDFR